MREILSFGATPYNEIKNENIQNHIKMGKVDIYLIFDLFDD